MDLTCEGAECAVVDLTNNDSVLVTNTTACLYHIHTHSLTPSLTSLVYVPPLLLQLLDEGKCLFLVKKGLSEGFV